MELVALGDESLDDDELLEEEANVSMEGDNGGGVVSVGVVSCLWGSSVEEGEEGEDLVVILLLQRGHVCFSFSQGSTQFL